MAAVELHEFVARQSDDSVKIDLELVHDGCGGWLCDIQVGDTVEVLVSVAESHACCETRE